MTKLTPGNWEPPYPAYVSDVDDAQLTFSQLAVQARDAGAAAADFSRLSALLDGAHGLLHHEHVFHEDLQHYRNEILLGYWATPEDLRLWRTSGAVIEFLDRGRRTETGIWLEYFTSPADHFETSYSTGTADFGICRYHTTREDPIHAYYGSMRDRIAAAEDGGLAGTVGRLNRPRDVDSRGRHLEVEVPKHACFIRTVQGWLDCTEEEREYFLTHTYPVYEKGLAYLGAHGVEANCISARLVRDAEQQSHRPQSETLAWFASLTDLEAWTWHHPTHDAIFKNFMAHARKFAFNVDVLLGHEVSIVPEGTGRGEYHNCHPATGFLPYFVSRDIAG